MKQSYKRTFDGTHKEGGQRDAVQVLCNALPGTLICLASLYARHFNLDELRLMSAYVSIYACCLGDTLASELGCLSLEEPRLVTTMKKVTDVSTRINL